MLETVPVSAAALNGPNGEPEARRCAYERDPQASRARKPRHEQQHDDDNKRDYPGDPLRRAPTRRVDWPGFVHSDNARSPPQQCHQPVG